MFLVDVKVRQLVERIYNTNKKSMQPRQAIKQAAKMQLQRSLCFTPTQ
jgi:hypothetical protein